MMSVIFCKPSLNELLASLLFTSFPDSYVCLSFSADPPLPFLLPYCAQFTTWFTPPFRICQRPPSSAAGPTTSEPYPKSIVRVSNFTLVSSSSREPVVRAQ